LDVVGFGSPVPAAAIFQITKPVDGLLSSSCPSHTSAHWYISGGTSALKTDEKILLYNPFSNDAAVRVTFYTPAGEQVSANLSNVGVGAGSTRVIPVNKFAKPRNTLGAVIRVVRGRVVAWASVAYRKHDGRDPGHTLRPGVTSPGTAWYLPDAAIDDGVEQHVTVLNPTEREASINVSLTMGSGPLPVATLATVPVGPRSTRELDLGQYLAKHRADPGRVSVTVRSANDVPVVVEGTTFYSTPGIQGVASVPAVQRPARRLVLEPPALAPTMDGIVVMNPDASPARVDVTLERVGGTSFSPKKLRNLRVPSGLRLRIPLSSFTQGKPMAAMVESSVPVVAGRTAYGRKAGDVASLAAVPLLPLPGPSAGR
jgi:hypothetical protein